jgi:hypothetical protein
LSREREELVRTPPTDAELRRDLEAAVGARNELGPEMEQHVIEVFLSRIEQRIDARIEQATAELRKAQKPKSEDSGPHFVEVVAPSLALSIPLVAIAGAMTGGVGVAAVMTGVFAINLLYFFYELMALRR